MRVDATIRFLWFLIGCCVVSGFVNHNPYKLNPIPQLQQRRQGFDKIDDHDIYTSSRYFLLRAGKDSNNEFVDELMKKALETSKGIFSTLKSKVLDAVEGSNNSSQKPTTVAPSGGSTGKQDTSTKDTLEVVVDKTIEISKAAFASLRFASAKAITASLPDNEREEVLNRMAKKSSTTSSGGATASPAAVEQTVQLDDSISVKEKIAAAVAAESQRDQERWEREKEDIMKQAEQAANERVAMEIEVQKQRIESERREMIQDIENSKNEFEKEKLEMIQNVESRQEQVEKQKEEMIKDVESTKKQLEQEKKQLTEQQVKQQEEIRVSKEELEKLAAEEKAELEKIQQGIRKREQQKIELEKLEADLRQRAQQVKKDKDDIDKLVVELQAAREQTMEKDPEEGEEQEKPNSINESDSTEVVGGTDTRYYSPKEYRSLSAEEKAKIKALRGVSSSWSSVGGSADAVDAHPVLGPVVSDLGYKRIHIMSAGKLGTVPIWEKQRTFRHNRAQAMAVDKSKTFHLGYPGVICLYEDKDGKLTILDGQHRVGMMQVLKTQHNIEAEVDGNLPLTNTMVDLDNILVEVYSEESLNNNAPSDKNYAEEIFLEINKAEPLKLIDMPGVSKAQDRNVITDAVDRLRTQYPEMFSTSQRCRVPNVNVDNMRNNLFGADIMKRHKLTTGKQLLDWMMEQNAALGEKYENNEEAQGWLNEKAWKKASRNGFYLGLESSWLYN